MTYIPNHGVTAEDVRNAELLFWSLCNWACDLEKNRDKFINVFAPELPKYEKELQERYQRFLDGDNQEFVPLKTLGKQPRRGIFGLSEKRIRFDRENWQKFYTEDGKKELVELNTKKECKILDNIKKTMKLDWVSQPKSLPHFFDDLLGSAEEMRKCIIFSLLKDNPFFLQDCVIAHNYTPSVFEGLYKLDTTDENRIFVKDPYDAWTGKISDLSQLL